MFDTFGEIFGELHKYIDDNNAAFTNPETCEYTEAFDEHCGKINVAEAVKEYVEHIDEFA